jgi:hypothetical protein
MGTLIHTTGGCLALTLQDLAGGTLTSSIFTELKRSSSITAWTAVLKGSTELRYIRITQYDRINILELKNLQLKILMKQGHEVQMLQISSLELKYK